MKLALAQINTTVGDIAGNVDKIVEYGKRAKKAGAQLVVFPELSVTGYPPRDLLLKDSFIAANLAALDEIALRVPDIAMLVGYAEINHGIGKPLFNACALIEDGKIKTKQFKTLLPTYDVFDEGRYFEPASTYAPCMVQDTHLGISICEDIWNFSWPDQQLLYDVDPISQIAELGLNLIANVSASPYFVGKEGIRAQLIRGQALKHKLPVVYVNLVGGNDDLVFDGRSLAFDAQGRQLGQAKAYEEDLLIIDTQAHGSEQEIVRTSYTAAENMFAALVLGTADFVHKCGLSKAVVGLSGGIDSAVTVAIAAKALGPENVLGVAIPSPYSADISLADAQRLAANLGIKFEVIAIERAMKSYDQMLSKVFAGCESDAAEENIQARIRGNILMAISNKFKYMVLATGNKSELAVGYCTLYGDMCGGLDVLSDVSKMQVYDLALYINELEGREIIPQSTMTRPPSAELRAHQLDADTLPPYPVLDAIIRAYVEQRKDKQQIVELGYDPDIVADIIRRINTSEFKRRQAAPGLKVTEQAFGTGWRMPIAQRLR
jgi:NAD+ synthetase